jgi:hypothetical protein
MACRQYAIKSNNINSQISPDLIATKFKENPQYDNKFFDDEEKDWMTVTWFHNKCSIGDFVMEEGELKFQPSVQMV